MLLIKYYRIPELFKIYLFRFFFSYLKTLANKLQLHLSTPDYTVYAGECVRVCLQTHITLLCVCVCVIFFFLCLFQDVLHAKMLAKRLRLILLLPIVIFVMNIIILFNMSFLQKQ